MAPTIDFGAVNYGCTKYKRRMVLYESVLQPGKRFEFCYSSSYQDKRGIETAYYKCVGCMHAKRYNDGRRIPKIAVRQGRLVNSNPDRPSNFPHFCQPIDSAVSDRRQREREISASTSGQSSSTSSQRSIIQQINRNQNSEQNIQSNSEIAQTSSSIALAETGDNLSSLIRQNLEYPSNFSNSPFNFNISSMGVLPSSSSSSSSLLDSTSHLIARGPSMNEVMQQQIQQLAANCFASTGVSPSNALNVTSQNLLFGMGMASTNTNAWQPITTTQ
uniref:Uncharacterized protein n=1 Tax=Meloidogyne enterolobii TaxID=390850 RepID=A0A6V7TRL6_MELEN|nr:unnamed protein product [Meloidogyne enterolobii]